MTKIDPLSFQTFPWSRLTLALLGRALPVILHLSCLPDHVPAPDLDGVVPTPRTEHGPALRHTHTLH